MKHPVADAVIAVALLISLNATASEAFGTREQAKALLQRAVSEMKYDENGALEKFMNGDDGFIDRDLYVFCGGPDGMITTHPDVFGLSLRTFTDKAGKAVGEEIYSTANEEEISEISYKWPRPGEGEEPVDKNSFYTRVGDQICGVGYYPQ